MKYKYPNSKKKYELIRTKNNLVYYFKCGHWCTDLVFKDLIKIEEYKQLKLFK
jgi:hypothetical protein